MSILENTETESISSQEAVAEIEPSIEKVIESDLIDFEKSSIAEIDEFITAAKAELTKRGQALEANL